MNLKSAKKIFWDSEEDMVQGPYLVSSQQSNIIIRTPQKFGDVKNYADALMSGCTVMISYGELDKAVKNRIFDYMNGVSYIIGAQVEMVATDVMIYAPNSVGVEKETVKKSRSWL
ncbi:MAG TPA: cell division protein SepF [Candidatus Avacidaminococcus intestinavium]|uniref:Cell division protein SepF n=1 Tax=Candidatus Avacidaminococcus intestinavium TaxID=2840684 RepID=A0A9D1MQE8_9FIRM|nr:cell division protein SepF [Candidatus Avacidaminococcus intestinavium]